MFLVRGFEFIKEVYAINAVRKWEAR